MTKREDIRKVNKGNSFYDVMKPRSYKDKREYQLVAGITKAVFQRDDNVYYDKPERSQFATSKLF